MIERPVAFTRMPQIDPLPNLFNRPGANERPFDEHLEGLLDRTCQLITSRCYGWRIDEAFKFDLPVSSFDEKRNRPLIEFIRHDQAEEELQVHLLSDQQLTTIKQDGTFFVNSRRYPIPYKWILNEWIYKGKARTYASFEDNLGTCFSMIYCIRDLIVGEKGLSLRQSSFECLYFMWKLLRLFVGVRSITENEAVSSEYLMEVDRHYRIYSVIWDRIDKTLFDYIKLDDSMTQAQKTLQANRVRQLHVLYQSFLGEWQKRVNLQSADLLRRYNDAQLKDLLTRQFQETFTNFVLSNVQIPARVTTHICNLVEDERNIIKYKQERDQSISQGCTNVSQQLRQMYPIRSKCPTWFRQTYEKAVKKLTQIYQQNMVAELRRRVRSLCFQLYLEYLDQYDSRIVQVKESTNANQPTRIFRLGYPLFPPYTVSCPDGQTYFLIKEHRIDVDTSFQLWKLKLYCIRYYTWVRNIIYWAYHNMVVGRFGLFVLMRCHDFYPQYHINSLTGEVGRDPNCCVTPIIASINGTVREVSFAREEFENSPDTGFFGKVCGRVFNIIYLYFVVSVLYLFWYLIIIKPIIIVLNVIFSIVVLLTAFVWMPIALIIHYLWCLLIFNCDYQQNTVNPREREATLRWFPLLFSVLRLVWDVFLFVFCILLIVLTPVACLFVFVMACFRYVLRRLYDQIMYIFISCCGRSPIKNTWVAWKTSGPGSTRNYFFNIKESDVYILVIAEMEKIQLEIFRNKVNEELNRPTLLLRRFIAQVQRRLGVSSHNHNVNNTAHFYVQKLDQQIIQRINSMPNSPGTSIRFMQEELNLYILNSKEIVINAVRKNPAYNFFEHMRVREGDFDSLVTSMWIRIFGGDSVLQPIEKIEQRLQIVQNRQVDEVGKIMQSISKQVSFRRKQDLSGERFIYKSERQKYVAQQRRIDANQYVDSVNMSTIIDYACTHLSEQLPNSKQTMQYSIITNMNIEKIYAKYQKYLKQEPSCFI